MVFVIDKLMSQVSLHQFRRVRSHGNSTQSEKSFSMAVSSNQPRKSCFDEARLRKSTVSNRKTAVADDSVERRSSVGGAFRKSWERWRQISVPAPLQSYGLNLPWSKLLETLNRMEYIIEPLI